MFFFCNTTTGFKYFFDNEYKWREHWVHHQMSLSPVRAHIYKDILFWNDNLVTVTFLIYSTSPYGDDWTTEIWNHPTFKANKNLGWRGEAIIQLSEFLQRPEPSGLSMVDHLSSWHPHCHSWYDEDSRPSRGSPHVCLVSGITMGDGPL